MKSLLMLFVFLPGFVFAQVNNSEAEILAAIVAENEMPIVLNFTAEWCGPCTQRMDPAIAQLSREYAGRIKFYNVDVDTHLRLVNRFFVRGIPSVRFLKNSAVGVIEYQAGIPQPAEKTKEVLKQKTDLLLAP